MSGKIREKSGNIEVDDKWQPCSDNTVVNPELFQIKEEQGSKKRGMVSFHQLCQRYSGPLTPTAPTVIWLWETCAFTSYLSLLRLNNSSPVDSCYLKVEGTL